MENERKRRRTFQVTVWWDNPPSPRQGVTIEQMVGGRVYSRRVGPNGLLTVPEAARALGVSDYSAYRLTWQEKLGTVRTSGGVMIPLREVKRYLAERRMGRPKRRPEGGR